MRWVGQGLQALVHASFVWLEPTRATLVGLALDGGSECCVGFETASRICVYVFVEVGVKLVAACDDERCSQGIVQCVVCLALDCIAGATASSVCSSCWAGAYSSAAGGRLWR